MSFFTFLRGEKRNLDFSGGAKSNDSVTAKNVLSLSSKLKLIHQITQDGKDNLNANQIKILVNALRTGYIQTIITAFLGSDGLSTNELNGLYSSLMSYTADYNITRFTKYGDTKERRERSQTIENAICFSLVKYPIIGIIGLLLSLNWAKVTLNKTGLLDWTPDFTPISNNEFRKNCQSFKFENEPEFLKLLTTLRDNFRTYIEDKVDILPSILELYQGLISHLHPASTDLSSNIGVALDDRLLNKLAKGKLIMDFLQFRLEQEFGDNNVEKKCHCQWLNCFASLHPNEVDFDKSFDLWLTYIDFLKLANDFIASDFFLFYYK